MPAAWMRRGFAGETPRMKSPVEGMARMPAKAVMGWFSGTPGMERRPVALEEVEPRLGDGGILLLPESPHGRGAHERVLIHRGRGVLCS